MTGPFEAGQLLTADALNAQLPGRKASQTTTSITSVTSEAVVNTVTTPAGALVIGALYTVRLHSYWTSDDATTDAIVRIREDDLAGTEVQGVRITALQSPKRSIVILLRDFTATATEHTFVATGQRASGTGNLRRFGSTTEQTTIAIDKV